MLTRFLHRNAIAATYLVAMGCVGLVVILSELLR